MQQLSLFDTEKKFAYELGKTNLTPVAVSFREIIAEIKDTTYLTHAIYYYPAKFIPHVVRFCINEFTTENDWIMDPFAGSGTVGLEAFLTKRNAVLLDLNYLLKYIIPIKIYQGTQEHSKVELTKNIQAIQKEQGDFIPEYVNISYWYPDEILEVLSHYWAGLHKLDENIYKWIIQAALVKISKEFSFAEHRTPKLFKSKSKKGFIIKLMQTEWKEKFDSKLFKNSYLFYDAVTNFQNIIKDYKKKVIYYAGIDSSKFKFESTREFDALITSPPYLQAQEYIRTSKLDLFWLGYTEKQIKEISKSEIPYRKAERIIRTYTLNKIRKQIDNIKLLNILDSYFDHTIAALENSMDILKKGGKICVFIGNPKIDGIEVEIWRIFTEYFTDKGFKFEIVFDDKIKTRQLFGARKNKNPDGMKSEYLLVLSKLV